MTTNLSDCDGGGGFDRSDATLLIDDVVFSGSLGAVTLQSDGTSTRILPALSADWDAPDNPYIVGVQFSYTPTDGGGETIQTSPQPPQAEFWKTTNGIVGGSDYDVTYRAVGVGVGNYGPWSDPETVHIDADVGPYNGEGVPTFIAPAGSTYQRQDVSEQYRFVDTPLVTTLSVTNPGGEAGSATGWTATVGTIGVRTNYLTDVLPRTGSYMLAPDPLTSNGSVTFHQDIAIPSDIEYLVDAGGVTAANLGCYHNPGVVGVSGNDQSRFFVTFLDGGGSPLAATVYSSWNSVASTWTHLTVASQSVPAGTRTIRIGCEGTAEDAVHDNFWDDFTAPTLTAAAGWRLMSDLTSITINGAPLASALTGLNFAGVTVSGVDNGDGTTTITITPPVVTLTASEALTAGNLVSFHNSSGAKVRKADKTDDTKQPDGFVLANVANGAAATVYLPGAVNSSVSGLTPGALYFLSTAGGITATPTTTPGEWLQEVGRAADATHLVFNPKSGVLL